MKYAVLGAAGQLGRDLLPRLSGEVIPIGRDTLDLARPETIRPALAGLNPDVFINCAAYNFVDKAEAEPEAALAVNTWGVRELALACRDHDCVLLHFSTDYVFGLDSTRNSPYEITDAPGPLSVYGLSKLAGEYLVRASCPRHFVARTCGLYGVWGSGGKGTNFVETMLRVAGQGKPLRVVADQTLTPSSTADVAAAAAALVQTKEYGLYHLTNAGACSWYEFAAAIFELSGMKADLSPTTTREYGAPAGRPGYSVLSSTAYHRLELPPLRDWRAALAAYLQERKARSAGA